MYSVDGPPGFDTIEGMTWSLAEAAYAGDHAMVESLQQSIFAMKGGKGGFRKGGLGKGNPIEAADDLLGAALAGRPDVVH